MKQILSSFTICLLIVTQSVLCAIHTFAEDAASENDPDISLILETVEPADEVYDENDAEVEEGSEDAQLLFNLYVDRYKEIAANNVPARKKHSSSAEVGRYYKLGDVVRIVDCYPIIIPSWYKTADGLWIAKGNLRNHTCHGTAPAVETGYKYYNNTKHIYFTNTKEKVCSGCHETMTKASSTEKKQDHVWDSKGVCRVCSYRYEYTVSYIKDTDYITNTVTTAKKSPYSSAGNASSYGKNVLVTIVGKSKNALQEEWFLMKDGTWLSGKDIEKHTHSFDAKTGLCRCYAEEKYMFSEISAASYEVTKSVYMRSRPYDGAPSVGLIKKGTVVTVNGYKYHKDLLVFTNKDYYRTVDGVWIVYEALNEHKHDKNTKYIDGICAAPGCDYQYPLKISSMNSTQYETVREGVEAYEEPYSTRTVKTTFVKAKTVVVIDGSATNSNGEKWYRRTNGTWVKPDSVVPHKHQLSNGVCSCVNCTYAVSVDPKTYSTAKDFITTSATVKAYKAPFDEAAIVTTYKKDEALIIDAYFEYENQKWYRTKTRYWVKSGDVREHKHTYESGICSCGAEEPIAVVSIASLMYQTVTVNVSVMKRPYSNSEKAYTLKNKGLPIEIVGYVTNSKKEKWYKTFEGYWIIGKNVEPVAKATVMNPSLNTGYDYCLRVVDTANQGIEGAKVVFGLQTGYTDANGYLKLQYDARPSQRLRVSADGYRSISEDYTMSMMRNDTIKMTGTSVSAVNLIYKEKIVNLLTKEYTVNQANDNLKFTVEVVGNVVSEGNLKEYHLVQNEKIKAKSTNGVFTGLYADMFAKNVDVYLNGVDFNDAVVISQKLLLKVEHVNTSYENLSLSFGKDIKLKLPSSFLNGMEITVAIPVLPLDIDVNPEKKSVKAGLNFNIHDSKTPWETVKGLNKGKFKSFYEKNAIKKPSPDFDGAGAFAKGSPFSWKVKAGGYAEGTMEKDSLKLDGTIFVCLDVSASHEWQLPFAIGPVPIVAELAFEGSVNADGTGTILIKNNKVSLQGGEVSINPSVKGTLYIGAGVAGWVSAGAYGSISIVSNIDILPDTRVKDAYLTGNIGLKAKLFGKTLASITVFQFDKFYFYKNDAELSAADDAELLTMADLNDLIYDAGNYGTLDRSYLKDRSGWYGGSEADLLEDVRAVVSDYDFQTLQSSTYTDIRPQVVTNGSTTMMVYADDNAERAEADRTMLVYSIYNKDSGKWSEPLPIADDGLPDFNFSLVSSDGFIYVVWQKATEHLTSELSVDVIGKKTDLWIAVYDELTQRFENIERITDDNMVCEMMPHVTGTNGQIVVAWFENSEDDVFGREGYNTVKYAVKSAGTYNPVHEPISFDGILDADTILDTPVEPDDTEEDGTAEDTESFVPWTVSAVEETQPAITSLSAGYIYDEGYIAFTIDEDRDYSTPDDQKVYMVSVETGELIYYTNKAMNVGFSRVYGDNVMTWYNQGYIYYTTGVDYAPQILYRDRSIPAEEYHLISAENGDMAILYTLKSDNQSDAYVILYDNASFTWGLPVSVTKQDKYIQNFNGEYFDNTIISVFNRTDVSTEQLFEKNDLCTAVIGERRDLMIENVLFDDIDIEQDTEYPLMIDVKNNGTIRCDGFEMIISAHGEIIDRKTVSTSIKPGEVYTVETTLHTPAEMERLTYEIVIDCGENGDAAIENNRYELPVGRANLVVSLESTAIQNGSLIRATVLNKGYEMSSGSIVLFNEDMNVSKVLLENFDRIGYYESVCFEMEIPDEDLGSEMYKVYRIGVVPDVEQYTDGYNSTTIMVRKAEAPEMAGIAVSEAVLSDSAALSEDASLSGEYQRYVSGTVTNDTERYIENGRITVMAYDERGLYVASKYMDVSLEAGESVDFRMYFDTDVEISQMKITLADRDTMEVFADFVEVRLVEPGEEDLSDEWLIDEIADAA